MLLGSWGVRLQFDPEYSPPSPITAALRPDLYNAYNRPSFSHYRRSVRVLVLDDQGRTITTGAAASMQVQAGLVLPNNYGQTLSASEQAILSYVDATGSLSENILPDVLLDDSTDQIPRLHVGTVRGPAAA